MMTVTTGRLGWAGDECTRIQHLLSVSGKDVALTHGSHFVSG